VISNLFTWLCVRWFRWRGWSIPKYPPEHIRNYVLVVAPHTSNIDFFVGVAARKILRLKAKYLAKKELFKFPIRSLLLNLGGYPVNRSKSTSLVDYVVEQFKTVPNFAITVTPEGTRGKVEKWRTGFYHIATKAEVPIIMVGFDYKRKWVVMAEPFLPSGDMDSDFSRMHKFFGKIYPRHPELSSYSHE